MKILLMLFLSLNVFGYDKLYPDKKLTPGVTRDVHMAVLCLAGSTKDVRNVTQSMKNEVFSRYGFIKGKFKPGDYEIDHFISLELGGANDIKNLWPQPYSKSGTVFGAREKDVVETNLHRRICNKQITLQAAQKIITTDWIAEYKSIKGLK